MTPEQEAKLDQIIEALPTIEALGSLLVRRNSATESLGLNRNTLDQNDKVTKFEAIGARRTYIEVKDVAVIRQQKGRKTKRR